MIDRRFVPLLMSRSAIEGQHSLVIYYFAIPRSSLTEVVCHVDSLVDYRRQSTFFGISLLPPNASALHLTAVFCMRWLSVIDLSVCRGSTVVIVCKNWWCNYLVDCEGWLASRFFPILKSGAEHLRFGPVPRLSVVSGFSRVYAESLTRARSLYLPFFTSQSRDFIDNTRVRCHVRRIYQPHLKPCLILT